MMPAEYLALAFHSALQASGALYGLYVQHSESDPLQRSAHLMTQHAYACRESLKVLSALADAMTHELSRSHAHKLHSLRLHFAAHAPEEDDPNSIYDLKIESHTKLGSTGGLLSTPHARTVVEHASSNATLKEGSPQLIQALEGQCHRPDRHLFLKSEASCTTHHSMSGMRRPSRSGTQSKDSW